MCQRGCELALHEHRGRKRGRRGSEAKVGALVGLMEHMEAAARMLARSGRCTQLSYLKGQENVCVSVCACASTCTSATFPVPRLVQGSSYADVQTEPLQPPVPAQLLCSEIVRARLYCDARRRRGQRESVFAHNIERGASQQNAPTPECLFISTNCLR